MKTIIYIRTSTEEQNPENQLADCLSINAYGEYEVIKDQQSAWKDNKEREGFERILGLIKYKKVEHLIVWDLDRVYRNRIKLKGFLEDCKIHNVKLHSYRQQWLDSMNQIQPPFNEIMFDLMINIFGWLAQEESDKKSARVKAAYQNRKGKKWGRPDSSDRVKKEVLELYNQGKTMREISNIVIQYDKNKNSKPISKSLVHKIINKFKAENGSLAAHS